MPDENGNRTIHEWMRHIDGKLDRIHDKLDDKTDKEEHAKLEKRVDNLALKVAGIAGGISVLISLAGWLVSG